ncbi:GBS Bsp-like repeat-containing protein [Streptococcus agalactiae]|uniref:GBS Bsp-like repeat-containing protein n=1 Tax=Streptococcus agalactiae TaxID=1311 RepID=UPI00085BC758|nr:GBS Bsp-like repeat-containing protein [Streptococcus agalactiae]
MRPIVRKKMYKKGKFWVVAGIVTILGGSAILGQDVKAEQAEAVTSTISEKTDSSQTISDTSKLTSPVNSSEAMENSTEPLIKTAFATSVSSNPREIAATPVKTFDASSKVVVKASTAEHSANQTNSNVNQVANDSEVITQQNSTKQLPTVTYSAHVQDIGWQKSVDNATVSGTVGQEKQVEAIKLSIKAPEGITGKLSYKTYVKGQGWQPSVESGQVSGTVGQSKPIEALSINLTDNLQKLYDVYYRVHVQDIGWMAWAKNGAYAGTLGMSKRLEAYEVKFTLKGQSVLTPTIPKEERPVLNYQVKVGQNGWQSNKLEGQMAGTLGESKALDGVKFTLSTLKYGDILYRTHVQDKGWGEILGSQTSKDYQGKRLEAIQLDLSGNLKQNYDIYYRAHVQDKGWMAWQKNNSVAGTVGESKRLEALEVKLVAKAPDFSSKINHSFLKMKHPGLSYQTYLQKDGWQPTVLEGQLGGSIGLSKSIKAIKLNLGSTALGNIEYRTFLNGSGWQTVVNAGRESNVPNESQQVEAIQMRLTGLLSKTYSVIYRVHMQDYGWQDWTYNNNIAGSTNQGKRIEAIEIKLVETAKIPVTVQTTYKGTGNYNVRVTNVISPGNLKIAIWSDKNNQDDLKWYTVTPKNHEATLTFNVTNHRDNGKYFIHVYQENASNQKQLLVKTSLQVAHSNYNTPYFSQRDGRWASRRYGMATLGETGCVPTSLAMILSSLKGETVLPTQIAGNLYHKTVEFNRGVQGTTSRGILKAAKEWGVTATALGTQANLVQALKDGYHVLAAVQNNVFVLHGSHEIVLKGYNNGLTHVSDPYTPSLSGWYPISQLWKEQSYYSEDRIDIGAPFVKVTDA